MSNMVYKPEIMNNDDVLLSIVIPVYNRHQCLLNLLESLSFSTVHELRKTEIIIVDDGSVKGIKLPVLGFPVYLYRLEKNLGAPKAREYGFNRSVGRFVHFHDSDDTFGVNWLSDLFSILESSPDTDILLTARYDRDGEYSRFRYQKFFHRHSSNIKRIQKRLVYRNCLGPLGGVIFSRRVLEAISFKPFASCQDWQMYLEAIRYAKSLKSCPHITYNFITSGSDRISHNPRKKILGHLQLSRLTEKQSFFHSNIKYFYLATCRQHVINKSGRILGYYNSNRFRIGFYYLLISIYWRLT